MQISCPDDYRQWLVSMFSLFGTNFVKLYSGPMWRVETTLQEQQAHVHVALLPFFLSFYISRVIMYMCIPLETLYSMYKYMYMYIPVFITGKN